MSACQEVGRRGGGKGRIFDAVVASVVFILPARHLEIQMCTVVGRLCEVFKPHESGVYIVL